MAEISVDFRNIAGSKKCAVSSPRIASLEIGDESSSSSSESAFRGFFRNGQVSPSDVKSNSNLILGYDKNFLIHSQTSLSNSTFDERPSDKIRPTDDNDLDLRDLLNSAKLTEAVVNFNKKNTTDTKVKIISNGEVSGDGLSDLLTTIAHKSSEKDEGNASIKYCRRKNTQASGNDLLDFDFATDECAKDTLSSSNSSLKVEGNLSELLSSINIEDSVGTKVGSFNSFNMCNLKDVNKFKIEKEPCVANLSDLLSSIDLGDFNDNNGSSCIQSDMKVVETNNKSYLSGLLQSDEVNNEPLRFGSTDLFVKDTNGASDSLNDFAFDLSCSSSNSYASSLSETENNSPKNSIIKNDLTDKVLESDSDYSSFDSAHKEFSFFDYSSDNQFSFNTLLTKKADKNIPTKHYDCEDVRNANEEMSMSDLLTIVSPEFKNPVLAISNKVKKIDSCVNEDCPSMLDLMESLNIKSKNSYCDVKSKNSFQSNEELLGYHCVDGQISKKVQSSREISNLQTDDSSENDILTHRSVILSDGDKIGNDDEQINFIDLRECIKSAKHQFTPKSPIKQVKTVENKSSDSGNLNKIRFYCEEKSEKSFIPFEFNNRVPREKVRVNTKQTMFSKALACKPKKDLSLLQKVVNIKNELLANIIYRPVFIDCEVPQPIVESVIQSDRCILPNVGLKSFGLDAPYKLQA